MCHLYECKFCKQTAASVFSAHFLRLYRFGFDLYECQRKECGKHYVVLSFESKPTKLYVINNHFYPNLEGELVNYAIQEANGTETPLRKLYEDGELCDGAKPR